MYLCLLLTLQIFPCLACRFVSNEFPTICGPACHPDLCEATDPPTLAPVVQPPKCGCESCTAEVWSHPAGGSYPCGDRIEYKMSQWGGNLSEEDACRFVSNEFPNNECGPFCNPDLCNLTPEPSPTPTTAEPTSTPTKSPTDNPTKTPTDNPTPAPTRMPTDNPTPAPSRPTQRHRLSFLNPSTAAAMIVPILFGRPWLVHTHVGTGSLI